MKILLEPQEALTRFAGLVRLAPQWVEANPIQYGYRIGPYGFLITPGLLSEVILTPTIYPIPNTASWLKGLINWRGNLVPVYDLAALWQTPVFSAKKRELLVIGESTQALGILVDELPVAVSLSQAIAAHTVELPAIVKGFVKQVYQDQDQVWLTLVYPDFFQAISTKIAI